MSYKHPHSFTGPQPLDGQQLMRALQANFDKTAQDATSINSDKISSTIVDAKGDIIVATADDTVTRKAVGSNNSIIVADTAQSDGLRWESRSLVASLPGSPVEGQVCYYQNSAMATANVVWQLRYNATDVYWELVGGMPLFAEVTTAQTTTSTSYVSLTTTGPAVTAPLAGDYQIEHGCGGFNSGANASLMSFAIGASAASDARSLRVDGTSEHSAARKSRYTSVSASDSIDAKYRVTAGTGTFENRWISILPVRVI